MTFLAVVGAIVLTGILLYASLGLWYLLILQIGWSGWDSMDWQDWLVFIGLSVVLFAFWVIWWGTVGTNIHVSFG